MSVAVDEVKGTRVVCEEVTKALLDGICSSACLSACQSVCLSVYTE